MSGPVVKGWCPGALRPMLSGDGWVVRVRPYGGRLTQDQAAGIARLALAHGNGWLDLSSRANLQIRGVSEASHMPLIMGLRALGLVDESAEAETRRNVIISPFADQCGRAIAADLEERLARSDAPPLPAKFGFAVDTSFPPVLRAASADIRIEGTGANMLVRAQGSFAGALVNMQTAAETALVLARWFLETGGVTDGRGRMAALIARGALPPPQFHQMTAPLADAFTPYPGRYADGFLVAFAFGQLRAETLLELAKLAPIRLAPWRMVLIEGQTDAPDVADLITSRHDPLLRVVACTGAPGCQQAWQPTRELARKLAREVSPGTVVHVAGCAKGCASPSPTTYTIVGEPDGFGLIYNGTAADPPQRNFPTAEKLLQDATILLG
jgi:precorrin-3B synthase